MRPLAATPVIVLSARAGEEARIEGLDAGANDYLVKPFGARELVAKARSQISMHRLQGAVALEREKLLDAERAARAEAQLQHGRLVSLFTQTPNPIVILSGPEHRIELANPAACQVWGRKFEDVTGKPLVEAIPRSRGRASTPCSPRSIAAESRTTAGKCLRAWTARNGRAREVNFNFVYTPTFDGSGQVSGVLVSAFDVSDEVRSRKLLQELRLKAEDANRTKDAFLAMLGHELRNPLSPIVSALKVLRMRGVVRPELDIVERQAGHLTRLVDDLSTCRASRAASSTFAGGW
jgi:PAS domain-containing protein